MVSVNALGTINARFGLDVGDELIAAAGQLLASELGSSDTIGRYGSNTFAVIMDNCDAAGLPAAAERLIATIRNATIQTSAGPLMATISVGCVALPQHARTAAEAIAYALGALELAKQRPQGAAVAHDPAILSRRGSKLAHSVSGSVVSALNEGRMLLMLQPIVEARTRKPVLYEGLLRLSIPDGTLVSAADFIEEAEALGLARRVDRRALELGLALLLAHPSLRLAINISSLTVGDEDWMATLQTLTAARPDVHSRLTIEMTETAVIHDFEAARMFLDRLRALGCKVAIDDFGAGYTSFRHLRSLNIDMLKLDGSLVASLQTDSKGCALVKSMIEMAGALGLETVAEWVGNEETAAFLEAAGVTYLQGFLFGQPMTVEELKRAGGI